jgi:hypothetical protein
VVELQTSAALEEDLKNALYQLKFGVQALEEHNVQPLDESLNALERQRDELLALCRRARELTEYLVRLPSSAQSSSVHRLPVSSSTSKVLGLSKNFVAVAC